jgi:acyl-CoA synthetase (NDP forming)
MGPSICAGWRSGAHSVRAAPACTRVALQTNTLRRFKEPDLAIEMSSDCSFRNPVDVQSPVDVQFKR